MRYCFTTLAIGDKYEKSAIKLFSELKSKTEFADFNITTKNNKLRLKKNNEFIKWDILDKKIPIKTNNIFNYNLKCLSLKSFINHDNYKNYEFIIYIDSDWMVYDEFEESKILSLLNYMKENKIDMIYERPSPLSHHKFNLNSYVKHKIEGYSIDKTVRWDDSKIMNEQFVIYKNNGKFKFYTKRWEQFLWYSIKNEINNFGEGLEMGISAFDAEMNTISLDKPINDLINNVFYFYDGNGTKFIRY